MSTTSVNYYYLTDSEYTGNHVRAEVIQVDNGSSHVNISINLQTDATLINSSQSNFGGNLWRIFGKNINSASLFEYGGIASRLSTASGTWTGVVNQWCATVPKTGSGFYFSAILPWTYDDAQETYPFAIADQYVAFKAYNPSDYDTPDSLSSLPSSATLGTAVTFTVENGGSTAAHTDSLTYSIGSASGTISAPISVASGGEATVSWTPPASLGAQFASSNSGSCTLTLTTKNSGGTTIGTKTYTCTLSVPPYSYTIGTITPSKQTYTTVGSSTTYIAGKTKVRFAVPAPPAGQYGATRTATVSLYYTAGTVLYSQTITGATNVEYVGPSAGSFVCSYKVVDSRGVNQTKVSNVTYIANPQTSLTFTAQRSGSTTTVNLTASGTYDSSLSGNTGTLTIKKGTTTVTTASGSSGTASVSTTTTLATTASASYVATMADALGNTASKTVTVSIAFAYMQVGTCSGKGVAIGKYGATSGTDKLEVGMPAEISDSTGTYKIILGPATVNNTTTWRLTIKQGNVDVCTLDPLAGLIMKTSSGNKTLELSTNGLEIKNVTGTTSRITLESTNGLTFKNASGTTTMNYPAEEQTSPYWRVTSTGYRLRNDSTGSGTILVQSVPTGDYPYLDSNNGWTKIQYSSSVVGWIAEASGQLIYK